MIPIDKYYNKYGRKFCGTHYHILVKNSSIYNVLNKTEGIHDLNDKKIYKLKHLKIIP